jgi:hypothetical protein
MQSLSAGHSSEASRTAFLFFVKTSGNDSSILVSGYAGSVFCRTPCIVEGHIEG